jgi:ABC-2 type transport system permease protein
MKGSAFKTKEMKYRLQIVKTNIINTFQHETAYFAENWSNLLSTMFYTLALLLFVNVLYANIKTFAGYTRNEMLFLVFIGQLGFYTGWGIFAESIEMLNDDIQKGTLDLVLIKPVPSLFFITFRWFPIVSMVRDSVPTLIIVFSTINWSALTFTVNNILWGIFIFICGQILWHCIRFLLILPAFWFGNARAVYSLSYTLAETHDLPLEGYSKNLRILFTTVLPIITLAAVSGSVMLGKSNGPFMALQAFFVTIIFIFIINVLWKLALRNYTSASS